MKRRTKIYMNKVLKEEENETHGMERKLSQSVLGEIGPEWPTMRHSLVKLMDCKEKKSFGHPSEKIPNHL